MEKENGESNTVDGIGGNGNAGKGDTSSLLDAASLFGAYWGRDANSQAAAASLLSGGAGFPGATGGTIGGFGLLGAGANTAGPSPNRYPPSSTLSVAASQAASLGLHPAASAAWWSMASQLAAQDYLARLQASGLAAFPPDPYAAALGALGSSAARNPSSRTPRATRNASHRAHTKEKNNTNNNNCSQNSINSQNNIRNSYGLPKSSSPSLSNSQSLSMTQNLSSFGLNSLAGSQSKASTNSTSSTSLSTKSSRKSSSSAAAKASALSGAYLAQGGVGSSSKNSSLKDKELALLRGDLIMAQAAMAQNAYQAAVAAATTHKGGKNSSSLFTNPFSLGALANNNSTEKDRHSSLDSIANFPQTILSDSTSILGGVRLPPDTEIIKYTSSIVGPKVRKVPGTTNRGRKKTISLDPPHVSVLPTLSSTGLLIERGGGPAKRPKLDNDYGSLPMAHQNLSANTSGLNSSNGDRVEVIKLPSGSSSRNSSPFNASSFTGLDLSSKSSSSPQHPTDLSQRDVSPTSMINDEDTPLNLSLKNSTNQNDNDWKSVNSQLMRSDDTSNSLNSLSNITAKLGSKTVPPIPERVSRRKPGAKPRRVIQDTIMQSSTSPQRISSPSLSQKEKDGTNFIGFSHLVGTPLSSESPGPKSSGSEDNDIGPWHSNKEGRPRNLGRGVSKPKKNTVASLLAQSRALGIRPALAHQYLQEATELLNPELQEKLKAAMNDPSSVMEMSESESEGPWESCPSDTEGSDAYGNRSRHLPDNAHLRIPIALGWKRETFIKGLSRNGSIKGDVIYYPPEPHSSLKIKTTQELTNFLEKNPSPPLTKENFSFSSRPIVGIFLQVTPSFGLSGTETEIIKMSEAEVTKRLDEAKRALGSLGGQTLNVEQRIELAKQQQAAREARKDAVKGREQARFIKEQEKSEKAEQAKREREARNQQIIEDWNYHSSYTLEKKNNEIIMEDTDLWNKDIECSMLNKTKNIYSQCTNKMSYSNQYDALDRIVNFTENIALNFSNPKSNSNQNIKRYCFKGFPKNNPDIQRNNQISTAKSSKSAVKNVLLSKFFTRYSRMNEFITESCKWTNLKPILDIKMQKYSVNCLKDLEIMYLKAKNEYMSRNLMLTPNLNSPQKSVYVSYIKDNNEIVEYIDLVDDETKSDNKSCDNLTLSNNLINDAASYHNDILKNLNFNVHGIPVAKRKKHEELEKQKLEDQTRKQQERELKRQQAVILKEQMYIVEMSKQREMMFTAELERERRRQHMAIVKQLDNRRRYEEREKKKHQILLDKLLLKEKQLDERKKEIELLTELRKPQEDTTLSDQKQLPAYDRIPGLKLSGKAMGDLLMVFEFLHNFGQTLGFDMETLPSLNTLQMALIPDCCVDAEEELVSVLTHLLACAIEDPGIPHPGRHTTILGQTLRTNEITPANISELLRIYLYANATGEVKALTGINPERDREKRIADHHQSDNDVLQQSCHGRNIQYYRHLHSRPSWKLAEKLRLHPYVALDPTTKAQILTIICDNLLQSKSILKQIDASLENLNQLRKERYVMDTKLRKLKVMHSRKVRIENAEKQQAIALERMQKMVEENEQLAKEKMLNDKENDVTTIEINEEKTESSLLEINSNINKKTPSETIIERSDENNKIVNSENNHDVDSPNDLVNSINNTILIAAPAPYMKDQEKEGVMDIAKANSTPTSIINKDMHLTDKDSFIGDNEIISDVESEGTQPEEDEDKNLPAEELSKKLEKLVKQSDIQLQSLITGSHSLRATCFGQDRYWRRYWSLSKCGGIFVEGMESAQPEIMDYHERIELIAKRREEEELSVNLKNDKQEKEDSFVMDDICEQQNSTSGEYLLDIEDSIPTSFLVQKPQSERKSIDGDSDIVKTESGLIINEDKKLLIALVDNDKSSKLINDPDEMDIIKVEKKENASTNNIEELKKIADSVIQPWETKENDMKLNDSKEKEEIIDEIDEMDDPVKADNMLNSRMSEGKWFSVLRKEIPVVTHENSRNEEADGTHEKEHIAKNVDIIIHNCHSNFVSLAFCETTSNCTEIILTQGNRWEIINNINLLNNPNALFATPNGIHSIQPINTTFYHPDSSLTMSGLNQDMIDASFEKEITLTNNIVEIVEPSKEDISGVDVLYKESTNETNDEHDFIKSENSKLKPITNNINCVNNVVTNCSQNIVPTFANVNLSALTAYVSCDGPAPIQMTPEESEQLKYCKINGLPKKLDGNFVPKELRHGWWRIYDPEQLQEIITKLHSRGVRERELHSSLLINLQQIGDKLHIEKGDITATELSVSHFDGIILGDNDFPMPDSPDRCSVKTCQRVEIALLDQIEALEDRVAAASMQVKGWKPNIRNDESVLGPDGEGIIEHARNRLLSLEGAIERRYLRPPLGVGSTPALATSLLTNSSPIAPVNEISHFTSDTSVGSRSSSPTHNHTETVSDVKVGIPRGLASWREGAARCQTTSQLAMVLHALESAIAWDKSIMKANCQFCLSGDSEDKLLLCDGCDKGYHTYCFKPKMDKIPEGDWYCFECLNKATGEKVCIVCGGRTIQSGGTTVPVAKGRLIPCAICPRAYHQDCHYPPMNKVPRGKWYCVNCISKAPPKKPRNKKSSKNSSIMDNSQDNVQPPSPAQSQSSTVTTVEDFHINMSQFCQSSVSSVQSTPEKSFQNGQQSQFNTFSTPDAKSFATMTGGSPINNFLDGTSKSSSRNLSDVIDKDTVKKENTIDRSLVENIEINNENVGKICMENVAKNSMNNTVQDIEQKCSSSNYEKHFDDCSNIDEEMTLNMVENDSGSSHTSEDSNVKGNSKGNFEKETDITMSPLRDKEAKSSCNTNKKDRSTTKRLNKELAPCKVLLEEMESHGDSWPFLFPVNTKQFPTYRKVIKTPMDLSTIKRKLQDLCYKSKEEFACDVRQIFDNCEVFNEDESPVGQAGHGMRKFFEEKWSMV